MIISTPATNSADAGRAERLLVLESHNSTWLFDEVDHLFARVRRGGSLESAMTWRSYDRLIIQADSEAFLVFLDHAGTRLLRARRHVVPCNACDVTQEFSLEELRALTNP